MPFCCESRFYDHLPIFEVYAKKNVPDFEILTQKMLWKFLWFWHRYSVTFVFIHVFVYVFLLGYLYRGFSVHLNESFCFSFFQDLELNLLILAQVVQTHGRIIH